MSIIIGVDPGLKTTGWGIINYHNNNLKFVDSGIIITDSTKDMCFRLKTLFNNLNTIIKDLSPNEFAIEETFVNKNPQTSLKLGHARAALMLAAITNNLIISEYSANFVKKTITGKGHADKTQIEKLVKIILPTAKTEKHDASDALAIAICHAYNFRNKLKVS